MLQRVCHIERDFEKFHALKCLVVFSSFFSRREEMFKTWKRIEKRFWKMKVKEEEKRQKAKKDTVDDQRKGDDGDKQKKDGSEDEAKKGDGDKRKRKDDDYIAGEELEQQIRAEADRQQRQEQQRKRTESGEKTCQGILSNTFKMKTKMMPTTLWKKCKKKYKYFPGTMRNQEICVDSVKWRRSGAKSAAFITYQFLSFNNFFLFFTRLFVLSSVFLDTDTVCY